jgi:hypothetical protein
LQNQLSQGKRPLIDDECMPLVSGPMDHDYAVSTGEYQTDQPSLKPAPAAAVSVLAPRQKQQSKSNPTNVQGLTG